MKLPIVEMVVPTKKNGYHPYLLRKTAFVVYTISIIIVNMLSGAFATPASAGAVSASELITLCNQERTAAGLNSLATNSKLTSAAHAKANNMFEEQYWDHYGPNGETPWQFILAAGYSYVYAGENLAKGFTTSEGVHAAWMASSSHRANIMNGNYKDIGIAVVPGELLGENVLLVVQMFGAQSSLPVTNEETEGAQEEEVPETTTPSQPQQTQPEPEPIDDSLDITYPEDGDYINDSEFIMTGTSGVSEQDIEIFNDKELLGEAVCEEGLWDYRPEDNWIDGTYRAHAEGSIAGVSSSVDFTVDTQPPVFEEESLETNYEVGILTVKINVEEDPVSVTLTVGDKRIELEKNNDGLYEGSVLVTSADIKGECEIVSSDRSGNYATYDICEVLGEVVKSDEDNTFSIGSMSNIFNKAIVIGLAILLVVDVYFLYKLNKVGSQGKTLFKLGLWIIILGVSLVIGTRGTIS